MTEDGTGNKGISLPFARIALILAALVAVAAIALAVIRSRSNGAESPPSAVPATPVGDVATMLEGLEKKLANDPDNAEGWNMLGWSYYNVGRYADAVKAYAKASGLDPKNPVYWSALGEVQVLSGPGGVTPDAESSFRKALAIDPGDFRARYFLAVKKDSGGDHKAALDDWIAILNDSPPGAPWEQPVRDLIAKVAAANRIDVSGRVPPPSAAPAAAARAAAATVPATSVATAGIPGPSAADLKAASAMTPSQQDEMAKAMVARLAARLDANPRDADGWIRLMRARMVLNDAPGAQAALARARAAFKGDSPQLARFDDAAKTLGVAR